MKAAVCTITPGNPSLALATGAGLLRDATDLLVVDSRGALGSVDRRRVIIDELSRHVDEVGPDVLGGVANSGSTWGVLLSERLGIDFVNILVDGPRSKGLGRQLEPDDLVMGKSVLLIDNWIETGSSIRTATSIVAHAGGEVIGSLCVSAAPAFTADLPVHIAFPFDQLVEAHTIQPNNHHTDKETQ